MDTLSKRLKVLAAAAALIPVAAFAELAVTTRGVNMRAGPDVSFPQVAYLGPGLNVNVVGCVEGWQWCDVVAGGHRGWVYSGYLSSSYYDRPTLISYGGPTLGIPLISFSIGNYWDNYYRGRPFWHDRARWYNHRVARAPEWHAEPRWHGNDWRDRDNRYGNDWRDRDNRHGNDGRDRDNRGNDRRGHDNRGDDRRATSDYRPGPPNTGAHGSLGPHDNFHAPQQ